MRKRVKHNLLLVGTFLCLSALTGMDIAVPAAGHSQEQQIQHGNPSQSPVADAPLQSQPLGWAYVDCSKEHSGALQRAIDLARPGDTILVSGTCYENVTVPEGSDRLTLDGGGTATIVGPDATRNPSQSEGRG